MQLQFSIKSISNAVCRKYQETKYLISKNKNGRHRKFYITILCFLLFYRKKAFVGQIFENKNLTELTALTLFNFGLFLLYNIPNKNFGFQQRSTLVTKLLNILKDENSTNS